MDEILRIVARAVSLSTELAGLWPQIEANYQAVRGALSSDDDAKLRAMIDQLHGETTSLTTQILALRDPQPVADEPVAEDPPAKSGKK